MEDFVCIRVTDLTGVDVGHFSFDWDTTIFMFVINADEDIYLRFGGRDDASPDTYLTTDALELALERGLELHEAFRAGEWSAPPRAPARFPRDFQELRDQRISKGECVHCHMIGSADTRERQAAGSLNKLEDLWVYPDIRRLGLELDVDKGLALADAEGPADEAGLKRRDVLTHVGDTAVETFADLQRALHLLPREAEELELGVRRKQDALRATLALPERWRITRIGRRSQTHALEPFPEFWGRELDAAEKRRLGLDEEAFGCEVTKFWGATNAKRAGLRKGDIVFAVDGEDRCPLTCHPPVYLRLYHETGDEVSVSVLRQGRVHELRFRLRARPW